MLASDSAEARAIVWHMHEYISQRPLTRTADPPLRRPHAVMVANSESVGGCADDHRQRAPVRVIYNAVDLRALFSTAGGGDLDALPQLEPAPSGTVGSASIATFSRWKGHDTFLRAMAALPASADRPYIVGGALYDTDGGQDPRSSCAGWQRLRPWRPRRFHRVHREADRVMRALDSSCTRARAGAVRTGHRRGDGRAVARW